jgi:cell division protein FtsI (penicillin-binding protein 3)
LDPRLAPEGTSRLRVLARIGFVWAVLIAARLFYLQVYCHEELASLARLQQVHSIKIQAPRGGIFDRAGQTLAMSVPVDSVFLNPLLTPDLPVAANLLSGVLELDRNRLLGRMRWSQENRKGFLWIQRRITHEQSEKLRSYRLPWVEFSRESQRVYPKGSLGANVIGSVDFEENGNSGLELSLNDELVGQPGAMRVLADVKRRVIESRITKEPQAGKNITLSIDERIQYVADHELKEAVELNHCRTGTVLVMEPRTGEILAMSNYPTFDPNARARTKAELAARMDLAVSVPFEPGSVFKVVTVAAALETTKLTPETIIPCGGGRINLFGRIIHDHKAYSALSMADVLTHSSNIGAIQIGLRVGERHLLEYVRRFGFGEKTGIPLPGESAGMVRDLDAWTRTSIGSVAMGHEISTTALQLALGTSVIASGGWLPKPRLVLWEQRSGGKREAAPVEPARRVLKPETAITMRRMMESVVLYGTGKKARLAGYSSGGKTGTAQIFDLETRRYTHHYNASFAGFAPVTDPAVVVVVTLNGASQYGGTVAAPVFQKVASAALRILGTVKDLPDDLPPVRDEETDTDDLSIAGLGTAPPPLPEAGETELVESPYLFGPRVPNFRGKSLRAVLEESAAAGIPVEFQGNGIARAQQPPPGSILPAGEKIRVEFAR